MRLSFVPVRFSVPVAVAAVAGMAVLSVGACGSSHDAHDAPDAEAPAVSGAGLAVVSGLVTSVAGGVVEVAEAGGKATVEVGGSSTKIIENRGGQLTDVVAGSCLRVAFTPESSPAPGGDVTVKTVQLLLPGAGGKCAQPKTPEVGGQDNRLIGTVAGVEGNNIKVNFTDGTGNPGETVVMVTDKTAYFKEATVSVQDITKNKCIVAHGIKDAEGKLQAKTVNLNPASSPKCPAPPVKK